MADSHDNLESINRAINFFNSEHVDLVIHAGDLISPFTAKIFQNLNSKFLGVFGNNDGEIEGLRKAYRKLCYLDDFRELKIDNKSLVVLHGTNEAIVEALSSSEKYDVVIRGHTHQVGIVDNGTLVINPGETCGYLTGNETVILMESDYLDYNVINLNE